MLYWFIFAFQALILIRSSSIDENTTPIEHLLNHGKASIALQRINEAILSGNSSDAMLINFARAKVQLGNSKEGKDVLDDIASREDSSSYTDANLLLGKLYMQTKEYRNFNQAKVHFERVLLNSIDNTDALAGLGKLFMIIDDPSYEQANAYLYRATQVKPKDEKLLFDYALSFLYLNKPEAARLNFEKAAEVNPTLDRYQVGKLYLHFNLLELGVQQIEIAMQKTAREDKAPDAEALLLLAESYDNLNRPLDAIEVYKNVISSEPKNPLAYAGLGLILLGTGSRNYAAQCACGLNQQEAVKYLRIAIALSPNLPAMKQAKEALKFCEEEMSEVVLWSKHFSSDDDQHVGRSQAIEPLSLMADDMSDKSTTFLARIRERVLVKIVNALKKVMKRFSLCKSTNIVRHYIPVLEQICGILLMNEEPKNETEFYESAYKIKHDDLTKKQSMLFKWKSRQDMQGIDRIDISTPEQLMNYVNGNKPVVINNFQTLWGANGTSAFTNEALNASFGESTVRVSVSESGRFDGPESGTLWGLGSDTDVLVRPPTTAMHFSDFLRLVVSNQRSASIRNSAESFYLEYLSLQQYLGEAFSKLIPMPKVAKEAKGLTHLVTNLWIGGSPTISPLHYDDYENLLCQIRGHKELIIFPPLQLPYLYYTGRPKGTLKYIYPGTFIRDPSTVDKRGFVFGSAVNIDEPDITRHPLYFKHATPYRVLLNPGDVLYLPAYWHHEVQSLPDLQGLNIATNFWFSNVTSPIDDISILGMK